MFELLESRLEILDMFEIFHQGYVGHDQMQQYLQYLNLMQPIMHLDVFSLE
jgi:hypothetical protein